MSTVDERIVEMKIDNRSFLSGVKTSQSALQSLNRAVDSAGNTRGMSALGTAVDEVKTKFSMLNTIAVTAVATITNKLVNSGLELAKSWIVDPVKAGMQNYEEQINAAKTILANTKQAGTSMRDVNKYLGELNRYAQKTVYNMGEMSHAVGTFTAAGVALKPATQAIQGIANLGAMTGSSSAQVSSAFTQMSQAISAGQIRLQDWNSFVQEGVANGALQKVLAQSAQAMGTLGKNAVKLVGPMQKVMINGQNFRSSMQVTPGQTPWLTGKEFTTALDIMSGTMTKAQLIAKGYTATQAAGLLKIGRTAMSSATQVKTLTQLFSSLREEIGGSWAMLFKTIIGGLPRATKVLSALHNTLDNAQLSMFEGINRILKQWVKLGGRADIIQSIVDIWHTLGAVFTAVGNAWDEAFPGSGKSIGTTLATMSRGFAHFTAHLIPSGKALKDITDIFKAVFQLLGVGAHIIGNVYGYFLNLFGLFLNNGGGATNGILDMVAGIARLISSFIEMTNLSGRIDSFFKTMEANRAKVMVPIIKTLGAIIQAFGALFNGDVSGFTTQFKAAFANLGPVGKVISDLGAKLNDFSMKLINMGKGGAGFLGTIVRKLGDAGAAIESFGKKVSHAFGMFDGSSGGSSGTAKSAATSALTLASATDKVTNGGTRLIDVFKAVGGWIKNAAVAIGNGIAKIWDSISNWAGGIDKIDLVTAFSYILNGAILVMVYRFIHSLKGYFDSFREIGESISGTFNQLTDNLKTMQKKVRSEIIKNIAISVALLAASLIALSFVPMKKLAVSLGALGVVFAMLTVSMRMMSKVLESDKFSSVKMLAMGAAILLMGSAMLALSTAVAILGRMSLADLAKGIAGIGVALTMMVVATQVLSKIEKPMLAAAAALFVMSTALQSMAATIAIYSMIDTGTMISGLVKMGAALAVLIVTMKSMPTDSLLANSAGLIAISGAMVVLSLAIAAFGNMDMGTIVKGLITLGASLTILVVAMNAMEGTVAGALALAIVAASVGALAVALGIMGNLSIGTIVKGLVTLAAALTVLLVAAAGAEVVSAGLLVLGGAVALMGVGMLAAGVGMVAFSAGLAALVGISSAALQVIGLAIQSFLAMLPTIAIQVAVAFTAFVKAIADASPHIVNSFVKIIDNMIGGARRVLPHLIALVDDFLNRMLNSIDKNAPKFGHTMTVLIDTGLGVLRHAIPEYVNTGMAILQGILSGIDKRLPNLMSTATDIVVKFINGISNHLDRVITAGTNLVIHLIEGIGKNAVRLADAAGKTILQFLNGIDAAVQKYSGQIGSSGRKIGFDLVNGLTGGLLGWGVNQVQSAVSHLADMIPGPIKKILGIASPSKVMKRIGKWVSIGLAHGILSSINSVRRAGEIMAKNAIDAVTKTATWAQFHADAQQAKADAYTTAAKILRHKENTEKLTKAQKKDLEKQAKEYDKAAQQAQQAAHKAQKAVDARRNRRAAEARFRRADEQGKADILNNRAESAAKAAERDREQAAKLAREADLIRKTDAKRAEELDKQAKQALADSEKAARAAKKNATEANLWAAKAIVKSVADVQKQINDDRKAAAQAAKLAAMTDQQRADYYAAQQKAEQAKSEADYAAAEDLLAKAKHERATNARQARKDIAAANKDVARAEAAKQAADDAAQNAAQYADSATQAAGDSSNSATQAANDLQLTMPDINIASSRVFGAQNMFDAYAKALAATQTAASADKAPTIQFNQTNNSPEALSATEIYRQSKTLLSSAERKLTTIS